MLFCEMLTKYSLSEILDNSISSKFIDKDIYNFTRDEYSRVYDSIEGISEVAVASAIKAPKNKYSVNLKNEVYSGSNYKDIRIKNGTKLVSDIKNIQLIALSNVNRFALKTNENQKIACYIVLTKILDSIKQS